VGALLWRKRKNLHRASEPLEKNEDHGESEREGDRDAEKLRDRGGAIWGSVNFLPEQAQANGSAYFGAF
jgi:hypothetical protein